MMCSLTYSVFHVMDTIYIYIQATKIHTHIHIYIYTCTYIYINSYSGDRRAGRHQLGGGRFDCHWRAICGMR